MTYCLTLLVLKIWFWTSTALARSFHVWKCGQFPLFLYNNYNPWGIFVRKVIKNFYLFPFSIFLTNFWCGETIFWSSCNFAKTLDTGKVFVFFLKMLLNESSEPYFLSIYILGSPLILLGVLSETHPYQLPGNQQPQPSD